jgi:hypothetical protein
MIGGRLIFTFEGPRYRKPVGPGAAPSFEHVSFGQPIACVAHVFLRTGWSGRRHQDHQVRGPSKALASQWKLATARPPAGPVENTASTLKEGLVVGVLQSADVR